MTQQEQADIKHTGAITYAVIVPVVFLRYQKKACLFPL